MSITVRVFVILLFPLLLACGGNDSIEGPDDPNGSVPLPPLTDAELLDLAQEETFKYFWEYSEANSGAARERYHPSNPSLDAQTVTTGGSGFGLMAILVGVERNSITRSQAVQRISRILDFFETADRFHGAWPHWIKGSDGKVIPFSTLDDGGDLVETAFLCQGLICVYEYFKEGSEAEKAIAEKAAKLWKGVDWDFYTQGEEVLYWHWSPNHEFQLNFKLEGYNEVLITYVLAAASGTNGISKKTYENGWATDGGITYNGSAYGYPLLVRHQGALEYGGPLFWSHYSYLGLNPNGLSDGFVNYGEVNKNHAMINYSYCLENPKNYPGYGPDNWGLTASYSRNEDGSIGYSAHAPGNDLGIISPTAALSSMPYTPVESLRALRGFYKKKDQLLGPAGFYDAFTSDLSWIAEAYLAIDQGPVIIMIENHRSGLLWNLFMRNPDVRNGLDKLGFDYPD